MVSKTKDVRTIMSWIQSKLTQGSRVCHLCLFSSIPLYDKYNVHYTVLMTRCNFSINITRTSLFSICPSPRDVLGSSALWKVLRLFVHEWYFPSFSMFIVLLTWPLCKSVRKWEILFSQNYIISCCLTPAMSNQLQNFIQLERANFLRITKLYKYVRAAPVQKRHCQSNCSVYCFCDSMWAGELFWKGPAAEMVKQATYLTHIREILRSNLGRENIFWSNFLIGPSCIEIKIQAVFVCRYRDTKSYRSIEISLRVQMPWHEIIQEYRDKSPCANAVTRNHTGVSR
jgi:hypothetical protein